MPRLSRSLRITGAFVAVSLLALTACSSDSSGSSGSDNGDPGQKAADKPSAGTSKGRELNPTPGADGVGDSLLPKAGNGGYDVQNYDLDVDYDPGTKLLKGVATISFKATQDLSSFNFDLSGLEVSAITVDGTAAPYSRNGNELVITPAKPLGKDDAVKVVVTYQGTPQPLTVLGDSQNGWIPTEDGAFTASEPDGAMTWFPNNNHPLDKATYDFKIRVPVGIEGLANGEPEEPRTEGGKSLFVWHAKEPMASYLATVTIGKFKRTEGKSPGGMPYWNAVDPAAKPHGTTPGGGVEKVGEIHDWLVQRLGAYPFSSTGAIVDNLPGLGYALETQGRPVYAFVPPGAVVAHEGAHQYFGDSVSIRDWKDIWLNEGFATYLEWMYDAEHPSTPRAFSVQQVFDAYYKSNDPTLTQKLWAFPTGAPPSADKLFEEPVYFRGAMTLHVLRTQIGDEAFFRTLKTWVERNKHGYGTTKDFIAISEEISGKNLGDLFQKWLYEAGKPKL